jgi:hypothetical protein
VARGASIAPQLLWFVAVYLLLSLVTPWLLRAFHRYGLGLILPFAGAAVAVDGARFLLGGPSWLGYLNVLFVWVVPYLLGFGYADGRFRGVSRRALVAVAAASVLVLALLVAAGPYPASMVGLPGDTMSNMNPPTICLLLVTGFQLPLALLVRGPVLRALAYRPVGRAVAFVQARSMTLYLWHLTAMVVTIGILEASGGFGLHVEPLTAAWWWSRPLWWLGLGAVVAAFIAVFGRFEDPVRDPRPAPPAWRPVLATVAMCGGLGVMAKFGIVSRGSLNWWWPLVPVLGLVLTGTVPAPGGRRASSSPPPAARGR